MAKTSSPQSIKQLMDWLDLYLVKKAPFQIPTNARQWIVQYGPWINIVILVILSPAILFALGIGAVALPFSILGGPGAVGGLSLALIALVLQIGLMIAALPGLFARKKMGWDLAFYSVVLSLIYNLISFNIFGGIIGAVIGAYVLFQIRSYYK